MDMDKVVDKKQVDNQSLELKRLKEKIDNNLNYKVADKIIDVNKMLNYYDGVERIKSFFYFTDNLLDKIKPENSIDYNNRKEKFDMEINNYVDTYSKFLLNFFDKIFKKSGNGGNLEEIHKKYIELIDNFEKSVKPFEEDMKKKINIDVYKEFLSKLKNYPNANIALTNTLKYVDTFDKAKVNDLINTIKNPKTNYIDISVLLYALYKSSEAKYNAIENNKSEGKNENKNLDEYINKWKGKSLEEIKEGIINDLKELSKMLYSKKFIEADYYSNMGNGSILIDFLYSVKFPILKEDKEIDKKYTLEDLAIDYHEYEKKKDENSDMFG
jgi:hypothetical protein